MLKIYSNTNTQDFIDALKRVGPPMGFMVADPYAVRLDNDRTDTILRTITKELDDTVQMVSTTVYNNSC